MAEFTLHVSIGKKVAAVDLAEAHHKLADYIRTLSEHGEVDYARAQIEVTDTPE